MRGGDQAREQYDYKKLLRRREWREKRAEVLAKRPRCETCKRNSRPLALHHVKYIHGLLPWEYPDNLYKVVCNGGCHREADEDREEQEHNARNERQYGWQGELGRFYRPPRGTSERLFRENEAAFHAWLIKRGVLPDGPWTSELYPLWYFWKTDSAEFLAEARRQDAVQGQLDLL